MKPPTLTRRIKMTEEIETSGLVETDSLVYEYTVSDADCPARLDHFIAARAANEPSPLSRSAAAKLCLDGRVFINGKTDTKNAKLKPGDKVLVILPEPIPDKLEPENIPLDIVYEDDDIVVVNKPSGMVVHPAPGHPTGTLSAALLYHCGSSLSGIGGVSRPGIVHRIDKDTSGLLVVAKNDISHASLAAQIKEHSCHRTYRAILVGTPGKGEREGTVDAPIGRHPVERKKMAVIFDEDYTSRPAVTHWTVLEQFDGYSLTECRLETGRTHQIRVHMSYIGHPVLGDPLYGGDNNRFCKAHPALIDGQCLHAGKLEFIHPTTGKPMEFYAPMPDNMTKILQILREKND